MNNLKCLIMVIIFFISGRSFAIMSGNPVEVMTEDLPHNRGQLSLEANFIFGSDISPDKSSHSQEEKGEWYMAKGTANITDWLDLYVRLGVSHLEQEDKTANIKEELEYSFAFGGGAKLKLYEYNPWGLKITLDSQYYGTFPDISSVTISSTKYTGGIHAKSYSENNIQTALQAQIKTGPIIPYIGAVFSYRDLSNKFTINNVPYDLSGKNKNKVGLAAGFDFPFTFEEIASGTGILSVEGRFFDETAVSVALTNRF